MQKWSQNVDFMKKKVINIRLKLLFLTKLTFYLHKLAFYLIVMAHQTGLNGFPYRWLWLVKKKEIKGPFQATAFGESSRCIIHNSHGGRQHVTHTRSRPQSLLRWLRPHTRDVLDITRAVAMALWRLREPQKQKPTVWFPSCSPYLSLPLGALHHTVVSTVSQLQCRQFNKSPSPSARPSCHDSVFVFSAFAALSIIIYFIVRALMMWSRCC